MLVRAETAADVDAVRAILEAAFPTSAEAELVARLRADGDLALALVAEQNGVVGYAAFPRLTVETDAGPVAAAGLAPLAVAPAFQRRGIGATLVRAGLDMLAAVSLVFVLGDPAYYRRFGFDVAAAARFRSPYAGPHFMLRRRVAAPADGRVTYPPAFAALG